MQPIENANYCFRYEPTSAIIQFLKFSKSLEVVFDFQLELVVGLFLS